MANDCNFDMKVFGKKSNIETLVKWLGATYNYTNGKNEVLYNGEPIDYHIGYRIFESYNMDEDTDAADDDYINAFIYGCCAWSVWTCMFEGESTYINDRLGDESRRAISIAKAAELLDLTIEIFSSEPGMAFAEHYVIHKGNIVKDDCVEYHEYEDEESGEWRRECEWMSHDEWNWEVL